MCNQVRHENSEDGEVATSLRFLESIHIFCIANMIARPIIVFSEDVVRNKYGEAISFNDLFGIYLPLLNDSKQCSKTPIILAYDQSHFCPLLFEDSNRDDDGCTCYVPLYQSENQALSNHMLPIKFLNTDPKEKTDHLYLDEYITYKQVSYRFNDAGPQTKVYCAVVTRNTVQNDLNFFSLYWDYLKDFYQMQDKMIQSERDNADYPRNVTTVPIHPVRVISNATAGDQPTTTTTTVSPPSYSSVARSNNDPHFRNNEALERQSSYDRAVRNGVVQIPVKIENSKLPTQHTQPTINDSILPNTSHGEVKLNGENQNQPKPLNGLPNDGRSLNKTGIAVNQRENSKLKQGKSE